MGKKNIYTSEYKTSTLSRFHQSGMSTRAFAESEGIKQSTLNYWLKKETEYAIAINAKPENSGNLIDVTGQVREFQQSDTVKLTVNGFRIELKRSDLGSLIGALRESD